MKLSWLCRMRIPRDVERRRIVTDLVLFLVPSASLRRMLYCVIPSIAPYPLYRLPLPHLPPLPARASPSAIHLPLNTSSNSSHPKPVLRGNGSNQLPEKSPVTSQTSTPMEASRYVVTFFQSFAALCVLLGLRMMIGMWRTDCLCWAFSWIWCI